MIEDVDHRANLKNHLLEPELVRLRDTANIRDGAREERRQERDLVGDDEEHFVVAFRDRPLGPQELVESEIASCEQHR